MLIASIVSSVLMMGIGMLYQTSMVNYNVVRDVRENLYTATLTSDRVNEALRKPNLGALKVRPDTVSSGNNVITFNYLKSAFQSSVTSWSGVVYYYQERLYLYENKIGEDPTVPYGDSFQAVTGSDNFQLMTNSAVGTWIGTESNRKKSEIIGYGVSGFKASSNPWPDTSTGPYSRGTTWTVEYLKAGRG
ncbi:MAG: hypothetical protein HYY25_09540 [Candidatus Wallbacteria bacterium]|nr:hypothetical protein [Candidatus Wallbacteria bacterium]